MGTLLGPLYNIIITCIIIGFNVLFTTDPGFAFVIDNVQWLSHTGHACQTKKNKMHLVCNGYAAKNKIPFRNLTDENESLASAIPIGKIVPSQEDFESLKKRMEGIAERILADNMECFTDVKVEQHIPHQYSEEANQKSEIVSLYWSTQTQPKHWRS